MGDRDRDRPRRHATLSDALFSAVGTGRSHDVLEPPSFLRG